MINSLMPPDGQFRIRTKSIGTKALVLLFVNIKLMLDLLIMCYLLKKPVGIIEAKKEEEGQRLTSHESQAEYYAKSTLKYLDNNPLPFVYESTGIVTLFTDFRDSNPRSRMVFTFHRPETFNAWLMEGRSLRARMQVEGSLIS
ncbi:MAG TPA: hypothetical protein C5S51_04705 [Methanosarcinaceae archaeon]|nr:hypothetical protein [Methanosarcinaceae archaeon]